MIKTERLFMRYMDQSDFPELLEMYFEEDSNKFIRPLRGKSRDEYLSFLASKLEKNKEQGHFFLAILNEEEKIMGTANLNYFAALDIEHVGVHLKRAYWSQAYGTEVLKGLIQLASKEGRKKIFALVQKGNLASEAMMRKCGFELEKEEVLEGDLLRVFALRIEG
ncbi:MAG: GNAT family N-acetyltransferase [Bacteroidetes bacterium]|nr:GNAT family N-acetyltransferase [Bacteroidota bacterium]